MDNFGRHYSKSRATIDSIATCFKAVVHDGLTKCAIGDPVMSALDNDAGFGGTDYPMSKGNMARPGDGHTMPTLARETGFQVRRPKVT